MKSEFQMTNTVESASIETCESPLPLNEAPLVCHSEGALATEESANEHETEPRSNSRKSQNSEVLARSLCYVAGVILQSLRLPQDDNGGLYAPRLALIQRIAKCHLVFSLAGLRTLWHQSFTSRHRIVSDCVELLPCGLCQQPILNLHAPISVSIPLQLNLLGPTPIAISDRVTGMDSIVPVPHGRRAAAQIDGGTKRRAICWFSLACVSCYLRDDAGDGALTLSQQERRDILQCDVACL